jgi:hypothetical protein
LVRDLPTAENFNSDNSSMLPAAIDSQIAGGLPGFVFTVLIRPS